MENKNIAGHYEQDALRWATISAAVDHPQGEDGAKKALAVLRNRGCRGLEIYGDSGRNSIRFTGITYYEGVAIDRELQYLPDTTDLSIFLGWAADAQLPVIIKSKDDNKMPSELQAIIAVARAQGHYNKIAAEFKWLAVERARLGTEKRLADAASDAASDAAPDAASEKLKIVADDAKRSADALSAIIKIFDASWLPAKLRRRLKAAIAAIK